MLTNESDLQEPVDVSMPNWGSNAPRGGMAVMNRVLKDKATVPLFFAQTLIQSLRDVGYNHTTSALCEHVDNAIQAGASEVRVFFRQTGKRANYTHRCGGLRQRKPACPRTSSRSLWLSAAQ